MAAIFSILQAALEDNCVQRMRLPNPANEADAGLAPMADRLWDIVTHFEVFEEEAQRRFLPAILALHTRYPDLLWPETVRVAIRDAEGCGSSGGAHE